MPALTLNRRPILMATAASADQIGAIVVAAVGTAATDAAAAVAAAIEDDRLAAEAAAVAAAADAASLSTVLDLYDDAASANLFDPATGVDNAGFNSNGSTFSLARYGRLLFPVTAGQSYTVSCSAADAGWLLNQTPWVNLYNSLTPGVGTLINNATVGEEAVAFTDSGRTVCFTAPTGCVLAGINLYNSTDATPDAAEYDAAWAAIMANSGLTKAQYEPYVAAGAKEFPAEVVNPEGPVTVLLSGTSLYVRQPVWNDSTRDTIRLMSINEVQGAAEPGTVDFLAQRFAPRSYATDLTLFAYNGGDAVWGSVDNGPPLKLNGQYVGGGHGLAAAATITKTGHGLTNADVGDVGTISGVSWVLTKIVDANTLQVVAANTGASLDRWFISGALTATGTITFAGAGAVAYTARTATQVWPLAQDLTHEIMLDDVTPITADGVYNGDSVTVRERYGIPNPARWLAALISEKGTATPKALNDPAIPTQVYVDQSWRFDRFGSMVGYNNTLFAQEANLPTTGSYSYVGAWQHQTIFKASHTLWQYVPDLSGTVGGYDLKAGADITANASTVTVLTSHASDPTDPPSHFAQYLKLSGTPVYGLATGYMRTKGAGVPATRAQNFNVWQLSTSEKQYPVAWDGDRYASDNIPAGTMLSTAFWDMAYDMADYPTHTVDAVYEDDGKVYRVIDIHATVSFYSVPMPAELVGKPVTVISKSSSLTLHTDAFVPSGGLMVSITGGWGRLIAEIG